jgi:hypothetical protein
VSAEARLAVAAAALVALLGVRCRLSGASAPEIAWTAVFLVGWVLAPGAASWRLVRTRALDTIGELGMAGALGAALLVLGFFALRGLEALRLFVAWPLVAVPLWWAARRRAPAPVAEPVPTSPAAIAALGLGLALLLVGTAHAVPSQWWMRLNSDDLFHAGNAAEVLRQPPLRDPRVAGLSLNYHAFSYALPAGLRLVSGLPVARTTLALLAGIGPAVLALLVYAAARALGQSAWAGVAAAALLTLQADLGNALLVFNVAGWRRLEFANTLWFGVTDSLPTCLGLVFATAMLLVLGHHLAEGGGARPLVALALLGAAASGTKASVMPVIVTGLAAAWLFGMVRGRATTGLGTAALVLALAAAPASLRLALGPASYAGAMFHADPLGTMARSGFVAAVDDGPGGRLLLFLPWLAGYLGPAGWLAALLLAQRRDPLARCIGWIGGAGMACALAVSAPGASERFFAYTGQIGLIVLAGTAIAGEHALASRMRTPALVAAVPFLLAGFVRIGHTASIERTDVSPEPPYVEAWRDAMEWLRVHAEPESLVVSRSGTMLVSAMAERRSLFELAIYTPQHHAARDGEPFGDRRELLSRLYVRPDAATLAAIASLSPDAPAVYVVCDAAKSSQAATRGLRLQVRARPECPALDAPPFERVFVDDAASIHRAPLVRAAP